MNGLLFTAQVTLLVLWYTVFPALPAVVVFIPLIIVGVQLAFALAMVVIAVLVTAWK